MEHRQLGASGTEVSVLALGSWRTFERMPRERGLAVMTAARESGIDFLDDARYDDETGSAPLLTGYSEVVFGELFRAAGWKRDEVVVANKLWWELWPEQSAAEELDASLARMRLDYVDLIYAERPPEGLAVEDVVASTAALIDSGKARAWGVLNWQPEQIAEAARISAAEGLTRPCAAQLPYSLAYPRFVEDEVMVDALDAAGARVVASAVLAGGALTGKYAAGTSGGRLSGERDNPRWQRAFEVGERLRALADEMDTTPSRLAIAFCLMNSNVASVLFGATTPEQIADNVGALELLARRSTEELVELRGLNPTE
jgi:aryl-alcohol dehydrogenase-like predicted oxidoreductase